MKKSSLTRGLPGVAAVLSCLLGNIAVSDAADYLVRAVTLRRWPSPNEAYALQSLLHRIPSAVAEEPQRRLTQAIHYIAQVAALARDLRAHPERLQGASRTAPGDLPWMGYGDEP